MRTILTRKEAAERKEIHQALGFHTYTDYLASKIWEEIRQRIFAEKGQVCKCGKDARQIHHLQYDAQTMAGKTLEHLEPICGDCHDEIHAEAARQQEKRWKERREAWQRGEPITMPIHD